MSALSPFSDFCTHNYCILTCSTSIFDLAAYLPDQLIFIGRVAFRTTTHANDQTNSRGSRAIHSGAAGTVLAGIYSRVRRRFNEFQFELDSTLGGGAVTAKLYYFKAGMGIRSALICSFAHFAQIK